MSDANSAIALDESKAYWMDGECIVQLGDKRLVREWRNLPLQSRTELLAVLNARTSVTNPKANTKAYTGVYRVLKVEDIVVRDRAGGTESLTLRETLALGFKGTSLTGELPRLAGDIDIVGSGTTEAANIAHPSGTAAVQEDSRILKIRWGDLNKDALEALQATRTSVTASALTVGTETKTGPWYLIGRSPGWEEDGTGYYEETWSLDEWHMESKGKTGNRKVIVNRYIQGVPKDRVKTVLDAEISALGATYGGQGYTYDQKIYWRELNADIITEVTQAVKGEIAAYTSDKSDSVTTTEKSGESLYDADLTSYAISTVTQGHTLKLQKSINGDGTLNAVHSDALAVKQEVVQYDSEVSYARTEKTKQGKNLFDADVAGYEITQTQGKVLKREHVINPDGTYDDVVRESASINQTASTDATHSDQHLDADDRTEDTERYTAATAPLADVAFSAQGTVVETQNRPNEDGTYETVKKTVVSKEQEIDDITLVEDKFRQVKADIGRQIKDATLASNYAIAETAGEIVKRSITENADGTFDVQRDRDIAKTIADAETSSEISAFETVTVSVDKNNTAGDTPPGSQTAGTIVDVNNRYNDYGRVDVTVKTRTATNVAETVKETSANLFETLSSVTDRNDAAAETPITSQVTGTIKTATSRKNEFGKFDNTLEIRTAATDITEAVKETSATAFDVVSSVTDRNEAAAETPITSQTAGTVKTATSRKNDFGLFDNTLETKTATASVTSGGNKVASGDSVLTETTVSNVASPAAAPSFTAGRVEVQRKRLNEFGYWDVETSTDVRSDQSIASGNEVKTPKYTSSIAIVDGASSAPTPLGVNEYGRVSYRKDKYGRYVGEKEVTTYVDTFTIPGWALGSTTYYTYHTIRTTYKGKGYQRNIGYKVEVAQVGTPSAAISHITGGMCGTEAGSSRYDVMANGQYRAIKISPDDRVGGSNATTAWTAETQGDFPA
jgi:hypothetical protein